MAGQNLLQNHIVDVIMEHCTRDESVRILAAGDLNRDDLSTVIDLEGFHSDIDKPSRGPSYLEWAVSNLELVQCSMHPALAPDSEKKGKKSDHGIATVDYLLNKHSSRSWYTHTRRKYNQHRLSAFLTEYNSINWWILLTGDADQMAVDHRDIETSLIDKHFPEETVRCKEGDAVFYNQALRREKRRVRRKYKKGATAEFKKAKKQYEANVKKASSSTTSGERIILRLPPLSMRSEISL